MKTLISKILSLLFPHQEPSSKLSIFLEETWLEKIMKPTQVKDYLWNPSFKD